MKVSGTVVAIASALAGGCGGATGTSGTGGAGGSMGPGAAGRGDVGAAGAGGRGGTSVGGAGTGGSMAGTAGAGSAGASGTGGRGGAGGAASGTGGAAPSDCGPGSGLDPMAAWPTMGGCYARRAATSVLSVQKPVIAWTQAIGVASDIAIGRDGTLYFGKSTTGGGSVLQAVRSDGTQAWSIDNALPSTAPTIGPDGALYFTSSNSLDGIVWAVEPSGTVRWKAFMPNISTHSGVVVGADGTVYAGNGAGTLTALNANGTVRFTRPGVFWDTTPAVGTDGTLYMTYGGVTAMTPSGVMRWQTPITEGSIFAGV